MARKKSENCSDVIQILGGANHDTVREDEDFYATPTMAVQKLIDSFGSVLKIDNATIFDPCVGKGHILKPFRDQKYNVAGTDLISRTDLWDSHIEYQGGQDFLSRMESLRGCNIVTNPPYKICLDFAKKGIELIDDNRYMCMLLKIQFLETKARYEFFKKFPPKYIYVFVNRIGCIPGGESDINKPSAICYAWYIWQKGYTGDPMVRWIA